MATLFGAGQSSRGRYPVAPAGNVDLVRWSMGIGGQFSGTQRTDRCARHVELDLARRQRALRTAAPSALRDEREHVQDVTATLDANIPNLGTRLSFIYRAND
jgi:hypothetical protein